MITLSTLVEWGVLYYTRAYNTQVHTKRHDTQCGRLPW